jgi:protein associated with RNAse G/E
MWKTGDSVILRGMYGNNVWYVQTCLVVHDKPNETALLLLPGAECAAPSGYIHGKHGPSGEWDGWSDILANNWILEKYRWRTNRFLILLEPDKYYASMLIWDHAGHDFQCYYINFQLPFTRSHCGFDTRDLALDIVIDHNHIWYLKDEDEYQRGIQLDIISPESARQIEHAQPEIFEKIDKKTYPLDTTWLNWRPNPAWEPPNLPDNWLIP